MTTTTIKKKKGYLNNQYFLTLLKQYEELNDDTSVWFRYKEPSKNSFNTVDEYTKALSKWNNSKEFIISK
jgi:hypothetical protein